MAVQKTTFPKKELIQNKCYLVDAQGKTLGRLAAKVATVLRGKHLPTFTPYMEMGISVIIINAEKISVTGTKNKMADKTYDRYSGFPSGLKKITFQDMLEANPTKVLELAINRMLPKTKLSDRTKTRLHIYAGPNHPHQAQKPEVLAV